MTPTIHKPFSKLWSIENGRWMVVSDLHGDGELYLRYRDRFLTLLNQNQVDGLIFLGDLIHRDPSDQPDQSLEIVVDILDLKSHFEDRIIYLCGNHETPHIYSYPLSKGDIEYTPPFEHALRQSGRGEEILNLFTSNPFYLRTPAGISLTHAGAFERATSDGDMQQLFNWQHQLVLDEAQNQLALFPIKHLRQAYARIWQVDDYQLLAEYILGISDSKDPHFDDLLRGYIAMKGYSYELRYFLALAAGKEPSAALFAGTQDNAYRSRFDLLWDALFTKCEHEYGIENYARFLKSLLDHLASEYSPQTVLVAGHMMAENGHTIVADQHFRLASGKHATPLESARYLIFDAQKPVESAAALRDGLASIF